MKRLAAKTEKKGTVTGTVKKTKVQVSINAGECIWETTYAQILAKYYPGTNLS